MAASVPLAESNGKDAFYYVKRQLLYGSLSFFIIIFLSILSIKENRRIFLIGFLLSIVALFVLPFLGTDHGKGAVRWISLLNISFQPSEFLKPFYIVAITWIMSSSYSNYQIPGKAIYVVSFQGINNREAAKLLERNAQDGTRLLGSFNAPIDHWLDFFCFTHFIDRDGKFQLKMLSTSSFQPLAASMGPMLKEESFHLKVQRKIYLVGKLLLLLIRMGEISLQA